MGVDSSRARRVEAKEYSATEVVSPSAAEAFAAGEISSEGARVVEVDVAVETAATVEER